MSEYKTSWGSLFAALTAVISAIGPFVPAQWQWAVAATGAVFGAVAVKIP